MSAHTAYTNRITRIDYIARLASRRFRYGFFLYTCAMCLLFAPSSGSSKTPCMPKPKSVLTCFALHYSRIIRPSWTAPAGSAAAASIKNLTPLCHIVWDVFTIAAHIKMQKFYLKNKLLGFVEWHEFAECFFLSFSFASPELVCVCIV